jgi:hypothetical protein
MKQEKPVLLVDIENTGERMLRPSLCAEIYDDRGNHVGTFTGNQYRIYPDTSVRYQIGLGMIRSGSYMALIIADCGSDDVFGRKQTFTIE